MYSYYFILGQNKNLSIAEVLNIPDIKVLKLLRKNIIFYDNVLIFNTKTKINCVEILKKLGGTIKVGEITMKTNNLNEINCNIARKLVGGRGGKVNFGFSVIGFKNKKFIKNLAISLKKDFRKDGINSRWVDAKEHELSSVVVKKNNLIKKGGELYIFKNNNSFYLGKTLAVQDFEWYSERDFNRPKRDILSGMIPPKLAKIMINLSGAGSKDVFLDPFCGSGTFLQEALLLNIKNVIGSDKSEKAVDDSFENLKWLKENHRGDIGVWELLHSDVGRLSEKIQHNSVDCIATEPYLGPTSRAENRKTKINDLIKELSELYIKTFKEFEKILKSGGKIVIIIPALSIKQMSLQSGKGGRGDSEATGENLIFLDILSEIKKTGFKISKFIPSEFNDLVNMDKRGSILYSRSTPNQRIAREIFIFQKR